MAELGSVFEGDDGPRGPDLRVTVEVPRAALGAGFRAPVPERLAADGELIERTIVGSDEPGFVVLHLPKDLPDRAMLRLRGHGGACEHEAGRAGDLLVVVELVDRAPRGDERILASTPARRDVDSVARREGVDMTWWLLAGLALICAALITALALL